jgi:glycosidase
LRKLSSKIFAGLALATLLLSGLAAPSSQNHNDAAAAATVTARSAAPSWAAKSVVYQVNTRAYSASGKFTAVTKDLPRLKALGIDVLWLMPIHPIGVQHRNGSLGSPYAVKDYKGINPQLGTAADLHALIKAAHKSGMHVILDWVANHSAFDHPWTVSHKDWYTLDNQGNPTWPAGTNWYDVADFNYNNDGLRAAMIDAMKYWVKNYDIDGYRADAAWGVDQPFWESAATALRAIKPVWMVAEAQDYTGILDKAFQADYGWHFKDMLYSLGSGLGNKYSVMTELDRISYYPTGAYPMLFITNHDENSWTGGLNDIYGSGAKAMAALTFVAPGIPLIYNGQEVDSNHRLAFFEKDEIDWNLSSSRSKAAIAVYKKLTLLRHKNASLFAGSSGGSTEVYDNDGQELIAFSRTKGANKVYIVLNTKPSAAFDTIPWGKDAKYYYRFSDGKKVKLAANAKVSLKAYGFEIYSTVKP